MQKSIVQIAMRALLVTLLLGATACAPRRIPPMTVSDLMEDRVTLDGVLMKCNRDPVKARDDNDCINARIAIERLAKHVDPDQEAKRQAEFERSREELRMAQDKVRREQEAKSKVDAYNLPLIPVDPQGRPAPTPAPN